MLTVNGKAIDHPDCTRWYVKGMTPMCRLGLDVSRCDGCTERESRNGNFTNPPIYELETAPNPPKAVAPARMRGLGDLVARATSAVGIRPCGGCRKRQEALNRAVPFRKKEE